MFGEKERWVPLKYLLPTVIVVLIVGVVPIIYSIYISFFRFELTEAAQPFIGLKNYMDLIVDTRFLHASIFTVSFALLATISEVVLGFILAYLLYNKSISAKFSSMFRVLMLVPYMVAPVVISYTFKTLIYDVNFGYLNALLRILKMPLFNLFEGQTNAAVGVLVMEIFLRTPFTTLIIFAGLSTVSEQIIEAARIDGAGSGKMLASIFIPIIKPVIFVSFIFRFMDALKMFDEMYVLTRGGPGYSTENLSLYVSAQGFEFFHLGKASAAAVLFFLIVVLVTGIIYVTFNIKRAKKG